MIPVRGLTADNQVAVELDNGKPIEPIPLVKATEAGVSFVLPPTLKAGRYVVGLKVDGNQVVTVPGELVVSEDAQVTPVITEVRSPVYPSQAGSLSHRIASFTIVGDHFGSPRDTQVEIAGYGVVRPLAVASECNDAARTACVVVEPTEIHVHGFSPLDFQGPSRVAVRVGSLLSPPFALTFAGTRLGTLRWIAMGVTLLIGALIYLLIAQNMDRSFRIKSQTYNVFQQLIIDKETNTFSLSKLQVVLWTGACLFCYVYFALCHMWVQWRFDFPDVPEGLPLLLGLSVGTSVAAGGLAASRGTKGAGPESPGMADFISSGGVVMPERFQFFVWTLVGVLGFVTIVLSTDPGQLATLPTIPNNFSLLMGVSSLGYLAGKTVRAPGPIVSTATRALDSQRGAWRVIIMGQNLDAAAMLRINEREFASDAMPEGGVQTAAPTRRTKLTWTIPADQVPPEFMTFEVVNPDRQSASGSFESTVVSSAQEPVPAPTPA
jgi:hypothetical protein